MSRETTPDTHARPTLGDKESGARFSPSIGYLGLGLTFAKPLFAAAIVALLVMRSERWAGGLVLFFMLADIVDGILVRGSPLARSARLVRARRVLDALGDRVCLLVVMFVAVIVNGYPALFCALVLAREIALSAIVSARFRREGVFEPNMWSRSATLCVGLSGATWLWGLHAVSATCTAGMLVLGAIGAWAYARPAPRRPAQVRAGRAGTFMSTVAFARRRPDPR